MDLGYNIYPVEIASDVKERITGSNQKGILIVYALDDKDHLDFLNKILAAIEINANQILSLVLEGEEIVKLPEYYDSNKITKILVFGTHPKRICFNSIVTKYNVTEIKDMKVIFADSLDKIQSTKELKKNLWLSMKDLFGV